MVFSSPLMTPRPRRVLWGNWLTQLVVTRRCNLACGYCNEFDKISEPVATAVLESVIRHLETLGTMTLELTGGEPLLHPDLAHLLDYARTIGIPRRSVITNGFLLGEKIIDDLNKVDLDSMSIAVDGIKSTPETDKVLERLQGRLELLRDRASFPVTITVVLGSTPPDEAGEIITFARACGFGVALNVLHDSAGQLIMDPASLEAYRSLVTRVHGTEYDLLGDYRWRLVHHLDTNFRCRAGSRYLYVDEFQQVVLCSQMRVRGPRKSLFAYGWRDLRWAFQREKVCSSTCTLDCVRRVSRLDEWRAIGKRRRGVPLPLVTELAAQWNRRR